MPMNLSILSLVIPLLLIQTDSHPLLHAGAYSLKKVAPNVCAVTNLFHPSPNVGVNAAFIAGATSLVFIDAGMTMDSAQAVWDEASRMFPGRTSVFLILSHFHCDHVFGMDVFKKKGARVIGHKNLDPWLDQRKFSERLRQTMGKNMTFVDVIALEEFPNLETARNTLGKVSLSPPDTLLEGDDVLTLGDVSLHIFYVPGHSDDLLAIYEPTSRTLVASDLIYSSGVPFLHDPTKLAYVDWIRNLNRIKRLPVKTIIPGHGPVCNPAMIATNIRSLEAQALDLQNRRDRVGARAPRELALNPQVISSRGKSLGGETIVRQEKGRRD
jgi:glyoxylase-like metal-dependent hydrolase (beta-lactamase superfamily II)